MPEYLVVYDYGMGGVWSYIHADSAERIERLYPDLKVVPERPEWMTDEREQRIRQNRTFDVENPAGWLLMLPRSPE